MPELERAIVIVLDGVGVGQAPDAAQYGDAGANCLSNCAERLAVSNSPHMGRMGIGNVTAIARYSDGRARQRRLWKARGGRRRQRQHHRPLGAYGRHPAAPTADLSGRLSARSW